MERKLHLVLSMVGDSWRVFGRGVTPPGYALGRALWPWVAALSGSWPCGCQVNPSSGLAEGAGKKRPALRYMGQDRGEAQVRAPHHRLWSRSLAAAEEVRF